MLENYKDVLNIEDVMEILTIGRSSAYNLVKQGELKTLRIGRQIRIPKPYMIDFLLANNYNDGSNMFCLSVTEKEVVKEHDRKCAS